MTNGEKIKEIFPNIDNRLDAKTGIMIVKWADNTTKFFKTSWWNAEYIEPTKSDCAERNGCITCSLDDGDDCCRKLFEESMQELTTKNDLGVDCIDRNSIKYYPGIGGYMYASKGEIDKLPSVTPQEPRKGHWIRVAGGNLIDDYRCDCCNHQPPIRKVGSTGWWDFTDYCPNCGARMVEPQESEDKEHE